MEELYGKLTVANLLTYVWFGDWDNYEKTIAAIPESVRNELSFHSFYNRSEVDLWHDNHFFIPGSHFVSPYFSSYVQEGQDVESRKKDLLCLIGLYEKIGFFYPLDQGRYPDHFGCLTAFLSSLFQEEIKAYQEGDSELLAQLMELEFDVLHRYILPVMGPLLTDANQKINHPFFKEFLSFYAGVFDYELVEII